MATGETLLTWTAESFRIPASSAGSQGFRNGHPHVALSTGEHFTIGGVLPRNYAGGGITMYIHYRTTSATTGVIELSTYFERVGDGQQDTDSDGFASAVVSSDITVPGTSGHVDIHAQAHTNGGQIDSIAVGEYFRAKVERTTPAGSDATGDIEVVAVELKET